jgi:signal peptide peptidase SppA
MKSTKSKKPGAWRRFLPKRFRNPKPVVAIVRLGGVIGSGTPLRPGLTLNGVDSVLEAAFKLKHAKAVALEINSPGGSPVQSNLIYTRIRALAKEHELPVYAFCEDVAASGGYWLACAGDEIYADSNSIIGSIGVISAGFGFTELIKKIGVERRVYTAGENKNLMDPFKAENASDIKRIKSLQKDIHESFKALVIASRGDALKGTEKKLFTGEFWTGAKAFELGLIDGLGDMRGVMREKYGDEVNLKLVGAKQGWLKRRLNPGSSLGFLSGAGSQHLAHKFADDVISAIEERSIWSRYGL